jgi:hypothetical protein
MIKVIIMIKVIMIKVYYAYYDTETITTTKSFIVQSLGAQWPVL